MYSLMVGRYRYDAMDFYTYGDQYLGTGSMNWWKIANSVRLYPAAAIWSILTITQILSMVGVAGEINLMAWRFGVMAWMLTSMIAHARRAARSTTTTTTRTTWNSAFALSTASE